MGKKKDSYRILIVAFVLLIMIMSFTGFGNYMTFVSHYNNALVTAFSVAGNETVRKIEYAVGYGKPIDNFYGMQDMLSQLQEIVPELEQAIIASPESVILYDSYGFVVDRTLPAELVKEREFSRDSEKVNQSLYYCQGKAYIFNDISLSSQSTPNQHSSAPIASLVMIFPQNTFLQFNSLLTRQLGAWLLGIAVMALILLLLIFFRTNLLNKGGGNGKQLLTILIVVLGGAQLCYTGVNHVLFKNAYTDVVDTSRDFIQNITCKNVEDIYDKGLTFDDITGMDEYFTSIVEGLPQIAGIDIAPLDTNTTGTKDLVQVLVATDYVQHQIFHVLMDMLTVLVISILFMVELSLLAVSLTASPYHIRDAPEKPALRTGPGEIRTLIFFVNFCAYMSVTFVPIVMQNLYQPLLGLSREVILGLPLSAEMLGGVIAIFFAPRLVHKFGWRLVVCTGLTLLAIGNVMSGIAGNEQLFILSRGIAGLGLGHILMAVRILAVSMPEPNVAIAAFGSGSIAGLSCSLVIGGLLADRIGYSMVFYCAALLAIIPLIYVRRLVVGLDVQMKSNTRLTSKAKIPGGLKVRKTIMFLFCIFIPYFISGAFLDYYFPLFASANGLSQSDISRGFLLNGLFIIYLGPVLSGYMARRFSAIKGFVASMTIVIVALTIFIVFGTVSAALVTVALLGIAESFGVSLKTTYFLNLPGVRDWEISKGIAYLSGLINVSRILGPMIYGLALSLGMKMGIGIIALGLLVLLLVFGFSEKCVQEYNGSRGLSV